MPLCSENLFPKSKEPSSTMKRMALYFFGILICSENCAPDVQKFEKSDWAILYDEKDGCAKKLRWKRVALSRICMRWRALTKSCARHRRNLGALAPGAKNCFFCWRRCPLFCGVRVASRLKFLLRAKTKTSAAQKAQVTTASRSRAVAFKTGCRAGGAVFFAQNHKGSTSSISDDHGAMCFEQSCSSVQNMQNVRAWTF